MCPQYKNGGTLRTKKYKRNERIDEFFLISFLFFFYFVTGEQDEDHEDDKIATMSQLAMMGKVSTHNLYSIVWYLHCEIKNFELL